MSSIKNGTSKSCGCLRRKRQEEDLLGKKIGRVTVDRVMPIEDAETKEQTKGVWYYCTCECGATNLKKKATMLRAGRGISCGCLNKEMSHEKNMIDMIGVRSGRLVALYEYKGNDRNRKSGSILWVCQCDCGNTTVVSQNALSSKKTLSCGCLASKNEETIKTLLSRYGVGFIPQYSFEELRSPETKWLLKFDFAVFKDQDLCFLIEYDGEQHKYGSRFSPDPNENAEKFRKLVLYDGLKNEYCKQNNIDLLRISYKDKNRIEEIITNKLIEKGLIKNGIQKAPS